LLNVPLHISIGINFVIFGFFSVEAPVAVREDICCLESSLGCRRWDMCLGLGQVLARARLSPESLVDCNTLGPAIIHLVTAALVHHMAAVRTIIK
jgi:hypothetical protein